MVVYSRFLYILSVQAAPGCQISEFLAKKGGDSLAVLPTALLCLKVFRKH